MLKIIYSISIISGTIIGVGLFALPYLTLKVGPFVMFGYFLFLGGVAILIHSFFGELAIKTKDFIRLPGFCRHYLGVWGYRIALISGILGMFGACLAYLIIGGEFLMAIGNSFFNQNILFYTFIYFALGAFIIFFGIKIIDLIQLSGLILFFLSLIVIFIKGFPFLDLSHFSINEIDSSNLFLPYGIILFSLWGLSLIPEAEEMLGKEKHLLKKIIPISIIIPIIIYLFFVFIVLGIMGENTTESSLIGLQEFLGKEISFIILFFGVLTTFTSFVALGLTLKKIFWYDLKLNENISWFVTCFFPFGLFLLGVNDFIKILTLVGGTLLAVDGILVSIMYQKIVSFKKRLLTYPVIIIFVLGIFYELIYSFNFLSF